MTTLLYNPWPLPNPLAHLQKPKLNCSFYHHPQNQNSSFLLLSSDMRNQKIQNYPEVMGIPVPSSYATERSTPQSRTDSMMDRLNKLRKKADSFVHGVRDHVSVCPNISETVKGKLSLGARVLHAGGLEGIFRRTFSAEEREKLLKASQCYLSTTAGPVAGVLFVSNLKIAFCSERSILLSSPRGSSAKVPYKVLIPIKKVKGAFPSENMNKPSQKYMYIVTADGFEFWFMGFVNYQKTLKSLQKAVSER